MFSTIRSAMRMMIGCSCVIAAETSWLQPAERAGRPCLRRTSTSRPGVVNRASSVMSWQPRGAVAPAPAGRPGGPALRAGSDLFHQLFARFCGQRDDVDQMFDQGVAAQRLDAHPRRPSSSVGSCAVTGSRDGDRTGRGAGSTPPSNGKKRYRRQSGGACSVASRRAREDRRPLLGRGGRLSHRCRW